MNWKTLSDEERLHLWKELRDSLREKSLTQQLTEVASFCKSIPRGARSIDYYSPEDWPTPWEIFYHGLFCRNSVSLIIFQTLALISEEDIELWLVKDNNGDYLLPVINDKFILNYELGEVSNHSDICDYFIVMQKFTKAQIKKIT